MKRNARWRRHLSRVRVAVKNRQVIEAGSLQAEQEHPARTSEIYRSGTVVSSGISRVDKALSIQSSKTYDSFNNCCLPQVALYRLGRNKITFGRKR